MFQTEHEFTLPLGYVDTQGNLHREGVMRLATAADEILPLKDPRVQSNQAYRWSLEEVESRLAERMRSGWEDVTRFASLHGLTLRAAATALAVKRVTEAHRLRGLYP